jgi:hypothetical protein
MSPYFKIAIKVVERIQYFFKKRRELEKEEKPKNEFLIFFFDKFINRNM